MFRRFWGYDYSDITALINFEDECKSQGDPEREFYINDMAKFKRANFTLRRAYAFLANSISARKIPLAGIDLEQAFAKLTADPLVDTETRYIVVEGEYGFLELFIIPLHTYGQPLIDGITIEYHFLEKHGYLYDYRGDGWYSYLHEGVSPILRKVGTVLRLEYPLVYGAKLSAPRNHEVHYCVIIHNEFLMRNEKIDILTSDDDYYNYSDIDNGLTATKLTHVTEADKKNHLLKLLIDKSSYSCYQANELKRMMKDYPASRPSSYRGQLEVISIHKSVDSASMRATKVGRLNPNVCLEFQKHYNQKRLNSLHVLVDKNGDLYRLDKGYYRNSEGDKVSSSQICEQSENDSEQREIYSNRSMSLTIREHYNTRDYIIALTL